MCSKGGHYKGFGFRRFRIQLVPAQLSPGHAHCRTRQSGRSASAFQRGHSHAGESRAGSGNEQEVSTLLRKEAIEVVPPLDKESGFYSRTSLFLGKGLHPILGLTEPLSHTTEV